MASTENTYTGNGQTTQYDIDFPFLRETDVKVTLDEVLQNSGYTHDLSTDRIIFTTAPANGVAIRIFRDTDVDTLAATFFSGSSFRAKDLNDNFKQHNYRAQEIDNNTWDKSSATIHSNEAWQSNDNQIATTAAMDARFQDEFGETITSSEVWPDNDDTLATTAAIDNRIDTAITNDIAGSDGVSITDDGDGTITVGLSANSVDFDRIKNVDIVTAAEEVAAGSGNENTLYSTAGAAHRFDTLVQTNTPAGNWPVGKTWLQDDNDKTLSIWNGTGWMSVASGGAFNTQAKVYYVDTGGSDTAAGNRISTPLKTIKKAVQLINARADGDGCIVVISPGIYQEVAPIQIDKKDVSIIGESVRSVVVHPTQATETSNLFELNSGSYISSFTIMGMKASGSRGAAGAGQIDADTQYGLPPTQGWNFVFRSGATILKSPYVHNVTNFSDSEIDNTTDPFPANNPPGGAAGDVDHTPTGGGMLIDGSVVAANSPLRSMVADSYTHTALDGPGIFVTNNGYAQLTSSYAFFCHYHIKCKNGGQANLAASTSDFGRYALIADGRSTSAIFTSNVDGQALSGAATFNINACTTGANWFGTAMRPASNMLVDVGGNTYPVRSAVPHTDSEGNDGWTVTIWRPNASDKSQNDGLNGNVADNAAVSFFLRSMIASSGHTMEYVGSGCDYRALPYNATGTYTVGNGTANCGVPLEAHQLTELNNGKIWTATTDHNGTFKIGGNQTEDPWFKVDQTTGLVAIPVGSIASEVSTDKTPQLGGNLDTNGKNITGTGQVQVNVQIGPTDNSDPMAALTDQFLSIHNDSGFITVTNEANDNTGVTLSQDGTATFGGDVTVGNVVIDQSDNKITGLAAPTADNHAANKKYVDDEVAGLVDTAPAALNTLNELAAAIADDASFSTTVTNNIAAKLPLAGGQMTGNVTCDDTGGNVTFDGRDLSVDGSKLDNIEASANNYTHPSHAGDDIDIDTTALSGAVVISDLDINIDTDNQGHVTDANASVATRSLTLADLGFTGNASANNYTHPNHGAGGGGDATSNADGDITIRNDAVTYAKMQNLGTANRVLGGTATGDISEVQVATGMIADDAVTYAKMQDVSATDRILGRDSAGSGAVEELSPATVRSMINVEDGATADQTKADIDALNIDADTLDGLQASAFVRRDGADHGASVTIEVDDVDFIVRDSTDTVHNYIWRDHSDSKLYLGTSAAVPTTRADLMTSGGNKYWHKGNDGTGSDLDADKVDGLHATAFLRRDQDDTLAGTLTLTPTGSTSGVQNRARLNISTIQGQGQETRAIDIDGAWNTNESASINFIHGSAATNFLASFECHYTGSAGQFRWGRFYYSGDQTSWPMTLTATSGSTADLAVTGNIKVSAWFTAQNANYGLYNEANQNNFFSSSNSYWHINSKSGQPNGALIFYGAYNNSAGNSSNRKGYVYWDSSGFGLLSSNGGWGVRVTDSTVMLNRPTTINAGQVDGGLVVNTHGTSNTALIKFQQGGADKGNIQFNADGNLYVWSYTTSKGIQIGSEPKWYDGNGYRQIRHDGNSSINYSQNTTVLRDGNGDIRGRYIIAGTADAVGGWFRARSGSDTIGVATSVVVESSGWYYQKPFAAFMTNSATGAYFNCSTWLSFNSNHGLYWPNNNGMHFYLESYYFRMHNNQSACGIVGYTANNRRGYVYWNSSSEIGFLNSGGSWSWKCDNSGNCTATGNVTAYSDRRIKENIRTVDNALEKVKSMRGVYFDRKDTGKASVGVIAQEIEEILPEVVSTQDTRSKENPDALPDLKTVAYGNIVGVLIEAIKELKAEVDELKGN